MKLLPYIKQYFNQIDQLRSVQVTVGSDGVLQKSECLLGLKKGEVELLSSADFEEGKIDQLPVVITIDGKGVLHKSAKTKKSKVGFSSLFPSVKEEEFFVQTVEGEKVSHVSIVRKNMVNKVLVELELKQEEVLGLYLGVYLVKELLPLGEIDTKLGIYEIEIEEGELVTVNKNEEAPVLNSSILGYDIKHSELLSFIGGVYTLLNGYTNNYTHDNFKLSNEEYKGKKQFKTVGLVALCVFLVVLLGNFMWLSNINKSLNTVANQNVQMSAQLNELTQLEDQMEEKKQFIGALGLKKQQSHAFLLDQVGQTVPKNIQLNTLLLNPIGKAVKKNKEITYKNAIIHISGLAKKSLELNEWKKALAGLNWVSSVSMIDYKVNEDGLGEFLIELEYN